MSFFRKKIATLLHDPPNKAWDIKNHKGTAKQMAMDMFGKEEFVMEGKNRNGGNIFNLLEDADVLNADRIASAIDRWVLGKAMHGKYLHGKWMTTKVSLCNPFSVNQKMEVDLGAGKPPPDIGSFTKNIMGKIEAARRSGLDDRQLYHLFYSIYEYEWLVGENNPNSPADTRIPIHTIFDHNYASATALNLVREKKVGGWLVHIDLGNVQNFIRDSRKLEHFWSSSWLVSSISWHIISPFVMEFGPDTLILPTSRSNPFYYHELVSELKNKLSITRGKGSQSSSTLVMDALQKTAKDLSGYDANKGFPTNAVMPATVTLILPSRELYPTELQAFESKYNTAMNDADQIAGFISARFQKVWSNIVNQIVSLVSGSGAEEYFNELGISKVPPLTLRTAIEKIDERLDDNQHLAGVYDKAVKGIGRKIEAIRGIKISPYVMLNLTGFTKSHHNFRICSLCGQLPGIPKGLMPANKAEQLRDTDMLCPYCLTKHLLTHSFQSIVKILFPNVTGTIRLPSFPSLAAISSFPFREKIANMADNDNTLIPPEFVSSLPTEEIRGETLYKAEVHLINRFKDNAPIHAFLLTEPEVCVYDDRESTGRGNENNGGRKTGKFWKLRAKGQGGHQQNQQQQEEGEEEEEYNPNTYFALLKGDGDDVGKIITGNLSDTQVFGSRGQFSIFKHFSMLTPNADLERTLSSMQDGEPLQSEKQTVRDIPASITFHATISRALMTFSVKAVNLVEGDHNGVVIYAGGDDIICVLPAENALKAAFEIRNLYRGDDHLNGFYRKGNRSGDRNARGDSGGCRGDNDDGNSGFSSRLTDQDEASILSMGEMGQTFSLVYSHYKYPLSYAIDKVNIEEENAKEKRWDSISKNNIAITYLARSSHDITVYLPLQRAGIPLASICWEIDMVLADIEEGKYSRSIISDLVNWKERVTAIVSCDRDALLTQVIKHILSRNIPKDQKPDFGKLAERIAWLAKTKEKNNASSGGTELEKTTPTNSHDRTLIEDYITGLRICSSARREIE